MKLPIHLVASILSYELTVREAAAYITSGLPGHRHREWLKQMTFDVCQLPIGDLTPEQCLQTPQLVSAWAENPYITRAERLSLRRSDDEINPPHGIECALECERLLKRLVDERRAGNLNAKLATEAYNSLMGVWSRSGDMLASAERTEQILISMQDAYVAGEKEVQPDLNSFKIVLNAWKKAAKSNPYAAERAQDTLTFMGHLYETGENYLSQPNAECYNIVLEAWARSRHSEAPREAEDLFMLMNLLSLEDEDMRPTQTSFNHLLKIWSRSNNPAATVRVESLLNQMHHFSDVEGYEGVKPNAVSYNAAIHTFALYENGSSPWKAEKILKQGEQQFKENGHSCINTESFNLVIEAFTKLPNLKGPTRSRAVLKRQKTLYESGLKDCKPDVYSYSSVLSSYASFSGSQKEKSQAFTVAKETFEEMNDSKVFPNHVTYGIMLKACARLPIGEERRRSTEYYFQKACENGCVDDMVLSRMREAATPDHYQSLMNGLTRKTLPKKWILQVPADDKKIRRLRQLEKV